VQALETWQSTELTSGDARLRLTAMPAQHTAGVLSFALPDVMGSLLEMWRAPAEQPAGRRGKAGKGSAEVEPSLRVYISGDTVMHDGLREIGERYPQIDVALLHLGGSRIMGVNVSLDAAQGVELLELLRPKVTIPIHYNDYEAFKSPLADFVSQARDAGLDGRVSYLLHGDRFVL
jgi:L-ascorbate metabolism protein UlaG (beta-lactamase superfamily)